MVTNLLRLPHKLASSMGDAPRITNTTTGQNMNQVLFRVGKSMELLSNRVWDPFPQGLMGKSMDLLEGLRSTMEGERELLLCFGRAKVRKKRQIY